MPQPESQWTPERDAELAGKWMKLPARVIAEQMGTTKNAIVGRARRINLAIKKERATKKYRDERTRQSRHIDNAANFKLCQWIEGEPTDRIFCEEDAVRPSSYCAAHHVRTVRTNREA
jgi:hypothetical protein